MIGGGAVAVEATRGPWAARAEAAIKSLRDVDGVSIQADGEDIRELHILTTSNPLAYSSDCHARDKSDRHYSICGGWQ